MAKKAYNSKTDIARWIAVLPLTALAIIFYIEIIDIWLYRFFLIYFDGKTNSLIFNYINVFIFAVIVILGGYLLSPKLKFKSTLLTVLSFAVFFVFFLINNSYVNDMLYPFMIIFSITSLLGLYIISRKTEI